MKFKQVIFFAAAGICFLPFMDAGLALLLGFAVALVAPLHYNKWAHPLLQASVVGMGFGMDAHEALAAGRSGFWLTVASITVALAVGAYLGRRLRIAQKITYLISAGTAICGGSAIAAIAPLVRARDSQISVAMGTVFLLNAVALFLFPWVGHLLHMSDQQFGLWAAIAIHDTSSVVGAAGRYGAGAVGLAVTVKLARALWIIPVSLATVFFFSGRPGRVALPWFIFVFAGVVSANTFFPPVHLIAPFVVASARKGMVLTLFLIGTGLSPEMLRNTGLRPLLLGIGVWAVIASGSLWIILHR